MSKFAYETNRWDQKINRCEVVKETAKTITIIEFGYLDKKPREVKRMKDGHKVYHDSWNAARDHLLNRAEAEVRSARRSLELANATLGNIKGMKEPQP